LLGGFATFFTFDALSFPVLASLMFICVGLSGSLYRLTATANRELMVSEPSLAPAV
jgi:hypothetical protein